jgi:UPF0042 nucleotide-binding protein
MTKMPRRLQKKNAKPRPKRRERRAKPRGTELVVITGMSGSGKASVLKAFEDMGYYAVDNLPVELIQHFAELARESAQIERAALVADIREGHGLARLPAILKTLKRSLPTQIVYLEASDESLLRRFSETRRPHPLGKESPVKTAILNERKRLRPIREMADLVVDTTKFNVHELRAHITRRFQQTPTEKNILVSCVSFGYKNGVPDDADLVFDVRFLPNPHFIPKYRPLTGRDPAVARYIRGFPQTRQFIRKVTEMLAYLLPHYLREGKSYLTIGFGCTGGQHRSVMIAEDVQKRLADEGYRVKVVHRDSPK